MQEVNMLAWNDSSICIVGLSLIVMNALKHSRLLRSKGISRVASVLISKVTINSFYIANTLKNGWRSNSADSDIPQITKVSFGRGNIIDEFK
jgi:hypothetical protein